MFFSKRSCPVLKKTQGFKTLLWLNGNGDYKSNKGDWKMVYPAVPLPTKIINIRLNENYNRDPDPFRLNECAIKRTNNWNSEKCYEGKESLIKAFLSTNTQHMLRISNKTCYYTESNMP